MCRAEGVRVIRVHEQGQVDVPIAFVFRDEGAHAADNCIVVALHLPICLRIAGGSENAINAEKPKKVAEDVYNELFDTLD